MIPTLVNNPLFRGITPERLLADLEEISFLYFITGILCCRIESYSEA